MTISFLGVLDAARARLAAAPAAGARFFFPPRTPRSRGTSRPRRARSRLPRLPRPVDEGRERCTEFSRVITRAAAAERRHRAAAAAPGAPRRRGVAAALHAARQVPLRRAVLRVRPRLRASTPSAPAALMST